MSLVSGMHLIEYDRRLLKVFLLGGLERVSFMNQPQAQSTIDGTTSSGIRFRHDQK
jgi:hypothetical protein